MRRFARAVGLMFGGLAALLVLVLFAAVVAVNTAWGNRQLLDRTLPAIDQNIAGSLQIDRVRLGIDRVVLLAVQLRDPEGGLVAEIERVELVFSPLALLRRQIDLQVVSIERPRVWLVQDERGLNLGRALAAGGRGGSESPARLVLTLRALSLRQGKVELRRAPATDERSDKGPALHIIDLAAQGRGAYDSATGQANATLELRGQERSPYPAPLQLSVRGEIRPGSAEATFGLSLGENRLAGVLRDDRGGASARQSLRLRDLRLLPDLARALLPAWPLVAAIQARGRLDRWGQELAGDLAIGVAGARIDARGSLDLGHLSTGGVQLRGEGIDLSALLAGAPRSQLSFMVQARGGGRDLRDLTGELQLQVPPGRIGGRSAGPVRLQLRAERGVYRLQELFAAAPGLQLRASGQADQKRLDVSAHLQARDLARASAALIAGRPPPLAGRGRMRVNLRGPWAAPALTARGQFPEVRYRGHRARALALRVRAPDLRRPRLADAQASARSLALGSTRLRQLAGALNMRPDGHFQAELALQTPQPLSLRASGRWSDDLQRLALRSLNVAYPEASWRMLGPAEIAMGDELRVHNLELQAGEQRIDLELRRTPDRLRGRARLQRIDLARLPRIVLSALPPLQGRLDATIQFGGPPARPTIEAHGSLLQGRVGRLQPISLAFDARVDRRRLTGDVQGQALGGELITRFDLPRHYPPRPSAPVELSVRAEAVRVDRLLAVLGQGRGGTGGTAALRAEVRGTAGAPVGSLVLALDDVRGPRLPPTDARLEIRSQDDASGIRGDLFVSRRDRALATARGRLALAAGRLTDPGALARAPIELEVALGPIDLQRLVAPAGGRRDRPRLLGGRVQATAHLAGTLAAPRLNVAARAERVSLQGVPLGQGHLELHYAQERPRVELRLHDAAGGHLSLSAETRVDLGYPYPIGAVELRRLPVSGHFEAQRYDLSALSCLSDLVRVVEGRLAAQADISGPLGSPRLNGQMEWSGGRLVLTGLGEYRDIHLLISGDQDHLVLHELAARSGGGSARITASADRQAGGQLQLAGRAELRRFPIRAAGQRIATVSMSPLLSGQASRGRIALLAEIDKADLRLSPGNRREVQSLERPEDVVLFWGDEPLDRTQVRKHARLEQARQRLLAGRSLSAPPPAEDRQRARLPAAFELQVRAPNNIWVRGPDANLELGLAPQFMILARPDPSIFGTVLVRRGQVEVLGRRFRLDDSSAVHFTGPSDRPVLDVRAVHQPRHAELTVIVTVTGPADALEIDVTTPAHPQYSQADLLAVILTGRPPDERADATQDPTSRAASLLGGFLADKLQGTIMRRLPIDVLNIDPGEGLRALQLEAGTYLGDDLYVAYVGRFGGDPFLRENQNEVQLEYRLSQRWSFQASYGDARRGSADLVWIRRY